MKVKALRTVFATLMFLGVMVSNARAVEGPTDEYMVKAAFLYNFAKFVEWPENVFMTSSSPINLFILGDDPFGETIETIRGKTVKGRTLVIKHISRIEKLDACHILFICSSEKDQLTQLLDLVKNSTLLTVGDMKNFARYGGIVNLVKSGNKVKFEVNVAAAQKAGLKISSKLLKLAAIVNNVLNKEKE